MGSYVNPFISAHVPAAWKALITVFGRTADYYPQGDGSQARSIVVIWKEGAEDEAQSPGRYSHALVQNSDTDGAPQAGDVLIRDDGLEYTVVRIAAYATEYSTVVLQALEGA